MSNSEVKYLKDRIGKRKSSWILVIICTCIFIVSFFILNIETTTRQGINHVTHELKIPLYLKLSNFLDRHWNYQWLVKQIVDKKMDDAEKIETVYLWTQKHIILQPSKLPVIDDHVWHIIIRGYGTEDQINDVFATLSNYAGLKAIILFCKAPEGKLPPYISLAAFFLQGAWRLCDVSMGIKFVNNDNSWASFDEVIAGVGKAKSFKIPSNGKPILDYYSYIQKLEKIDLDRLYEVNRSSIQNPLARFLYFLKDRKI